MKAAGAIIFTILLLSQTFSKNWVYLSFKLNQEYIAKTLCVQRNISNNICCGKCHLKKQLQKEDQEEQKQLPAGSKERFEVLSYRTITDLLYLKTFDEYPIKPAFPGWKCRLYASSYISGIFHPPQFIIPSV